MRPTASSPPTACSSSSRRGPVDPDRRSAALSARATGASGRTVAGLRPRSLSRCRCSPRRVSLRSDRGSAHRLRLRGRARMPAPTRSAGWSRPLSRISTPGLAASGLAALDDYATAALGTPSGARPGSRRILTRIGDDGIVAVSWGMGLNGAVALLVPAGRACLAGSPCPDARRCRPSGGRAARLPARRYSAIAALLPIASTASSSSSLPPPRRKSSDPGAVPSFGYAYLAAASLVDKSRRSPMGSSPPCRWRRIGLEVGGSRSAMWALPRRGSRSSPIGAAVGSSPSPARHSSSACSAEPTAATSATR